MNPSFSFWNDLKKAEICQWPEIVRNHKLTNEDIVQAGSLIKKGYFYDCWLNALCIECFAAGILNADQVFKKYDLNKDETVMIKEELFKRFYDDDKSWKFKMYKGV